MKKLLLTILLNVLLLLPVVGWGGVHGCNRYEDGRSGEILGLQIRASEGGAIAVAIIFAVFEYELNQHLESISVKYSDIVWWDYPDKDFDIVDWHKTSICKNQYG